MQESQVASSINKKGCFPTKAGVRGDPLSDISIQHRIVGSSRSEQGEKKNQTGKKNGTKGITDGKEKVKITTVHRWHDL